jgi:hypothetical protein
MSLLKNNIDLEKGIRDDLLPPAIKPGLGSPTDDDRTKRIGLKNESKKAKVLGLVFLIFTFLFVGLIALSFNGEAQVRQRGIFSRCMCCPCGDEINVDDKECSKTTFEYTFYSTEAAFPSLFETARTLDGTSSSRSSERGSSNFDSPALDSPGLCFSPPQRMPRKIEHVYAPDWEAQITEKFGGQTTQQRLDGQLITHKGGKRLEDPKQGEQFVWNCEEYLNEMGLCPLPGTKSKGLDRFRECIRLLLLCKYDWSDIVLVTLHAIEYFQWILKRRPAMINKEKSFVLAIAVYLAHSFLLDETCPLKHWHRHIFQKYCPLKVVDKAVFQCMGILKYKLRVELFEWKFLELAAHVMTGESDASAALISSFEKTD